MDMKYWSTESGEHRLSDKFTEWKISPRVIQHRPYMKEVNDVQVELRTWFQTREKWQLILDTALPAFQQLEVDLLNSNLPVVRAAHDTIQALDMLHFISFTAYEKMIALLTTVMLSFDKFLQAELDRKFYTPDVAVRKPTDEDTNYAEKEKQLNEDLDSVILEIDKEKEKSSSKKKITQKEQDND